MKSMIYVILDRSGSMSGREKDVIGGVNNFIADQKKLPDPASMAFVRFDTQIERFRPMQSLEKVEPLSEAEFAPRGMTALLDAVGQTINEAEKDWLVEKPERCIMVIVTDGQENSSKEFNKGKIKELITAREKSGLWAFIYLGANVDAFSEASALGINLQNAAGYTSSAAGTRSLYATASASVGHMRMSGSTVAHNLGGNIAEDGTLSKPGKSQIGTVPTDPADALQAKIDAAKAISDAAAQTNQKATGKPSWSPPTASTSSDAWKPPA